jgi:hypothetical protein
VNLSDGCATIENWLVAMNGGTEYLFQKTIDAQPSCAGKKQPSKHERIERLIEFYEIVEAADVSSVSRSGSQRSY